MLALSSSALKLVAFEHGYVQIRENMQRRIISMCVIAPQEPRGTLAVAFLVPFFANGGGVHGDAHAQTRRRVFGQKFELLLVAYHHLSEATGKYFVFRE